MLVGAASRALGGRHELDAVVLAVLGGVQELGGEDADNAHHLV